MPPHKRKLDCVKASSASAKKLKANIATSVQEDLTKHYRVIDFLLVFSTISTLVKCQICDGQITFESCRKEGLGFNIKVACDKCKDFRYVPSSNRIDSGVYEVNYRFAFVMRILGLGLSGCDKFCGLMDFSSSFLSKSVYNSYVQKISETVQNVSKQMFSSAIAEEKEETSEANNVEDTDELTVSGDGTWKKRGFSSLFGVSSLIGHYSGKVLDICVKSLYCHACKTWENKLESQEYKEWHENHINNHECRANHIGPSGSMEVSAIVEMFKRSTDLGVKYRNYIGDGDSKTYIGVLNAHPYGEEFKINKKECIGHVQKRMGTRLRTLVKTSTVDTKTKDGKIVKRKSLGGKGKLTAKVIAKLTVYYGLAIRRNHHSVEKMREAIWATLYHYASTDQNPQHEKCPRGDDSWCEWQRAAAANAVQNFKHTYTALPEDVIEAIHPIYDDLSGDSLLQRCVGGFTQNNNESLNQLIWKISPKSVSGTSTIVEIAANVASGVFNEGAFSFLKFMEEMKIGMGPSSHEWARASDRERITRAEKEAENVSKTIRMERRQEQKDALDATEEHPVLYGPGIDDSM